MNIFDTVAIKKPPTSTFDLSNEVVTSFNPGELVPVIVEEIMPGDFVRLDVANLVRMAPTVAPLMHRVHVDTHFFFVPYRLLWSEWDKFITQQEDISIPYVQLGLGSTANYPLRSVADKIGMPTEQLSSDPGIDIKVSPFFLAAYYLIYDEYYRRQDIDEKVFVPLVSGSNIEYAPTEGLGSSLPLKRGWGNGYLTSALPFAQKGPEVQIPLTQQEQLDVYLRVHGGEDYSSMTLKGLDNTVNLPDSALTNAPGPVPLTDSLHVGVTPVVIDPADNLKVDIQSAAADIETFRFALALQRYYEKLARAGNRYTEWLQSVFAVRPEDYRLQRPEYIGGVRQTVSISEVLSTAQNLSEDAVVGQMAGHSVSLGGSQRTTFRAKEHGVLMSIVSLRPRASYFQGLHRKFSRLVPTDFPMPDFAHLGEQAIENKEVLINHPQPDDTFGYIPRYAEMRIGQDRVSSDMKASLNFWHWARKFDPLNPPALNSEFVQCTPDDRVWAVTTDATDHVYLHSFNKIIVNRRLPRYGIPRIE